MTTKHLVRLVVVFIVLLAALIPGPATAATTVTELIKGLDNPRGVALNNGSLFVGEAGHGGSSGGPACVTTPPPPSGIGEICVGFTSQITRVNLASAHAQPLVSGLFSISLGVQGVLGISGLSVGDDGRILGIIGAAPQEADALIPCSTAACHNIINAAKTQAGHLISVSHDGQWHSVASVGEFNFEYTKTLPNPKEIDANPYGVLASEDGALVVDAGANTLSLVDENGKISNPPLQHFQRFDPNTFPADAVPTCVARTEGALWVADLSGRLFRLSEDGTGAQVEVAVKNAQGKSLIHHVTGCAAGQNGSLYLVDMWGTAGLPSAGTGSVVQFSPKSGHAKLVAPGLNFPNMIAVGDHGTLYVSTNSVCPAAALTVTTGPCAGGGKVLKISGRGGEENGDNGD
jgi:hypothetical protein